VVIAFADLNLWVILVDTLSDRCRLREIERGSSYPTQLSCRDQGCIHCGDLVSLNLQNVTENVTIALPGEIEVGMVR